MLYGQGVEDAVFCLFFFGVEMWQKHKGGTDAAPFPFQSICLGAHHGYC